MSAAIPSRANVIFMVSSTFQKNAAILKDVPR